MLRIKISIPVDTTMLIRQHIRCCSVRIRTADSILGRGDANMSIHYRGPAVRVRFPIMILQKQKRLCPLRRILGETLRDIQHSILMLGGLFVSLACGCQLFVDDADRDVQRLVEKRQQEALGGTHPIHVEEPSSPSADRDAHRFAPHPVKTEIPEEFLAPPAPSSEPTSDDSSLTKPSGDSSETTIQEDVKWEDLRFGDPLPLSEALKYAVEHSREYQTAQESLYLQALALSLERFLWTPQFVSSLKTTYTENPKNAVPDRTLQAIADVAVTQKLPYGGEVVAQWVGTMVRDMEQHAMLGESGTAILSANIPLLKGVGPVAFESRFQAERNLIYAVRRFEFFRGDFLTRVAGDYFDLLSARSGIYNAMASRDAAKESWQRSQALADAERLMRLDADRARVSYLQNQNSVINAIAGYQSSLDRFKILLGMPIATPVDVVDEEIELARPSASEEAATATALLRRLDLLNTQDAVDDARRQVEIAKNNLLPSLNVTGSASDATNADHLSTMDFRQDNYTWNVGAELEIPLQRLPERNAYRSSLIGLRQAERAYDQAADGVRVDVRQAIRECEQARQSLAIQEQNIKINEVRSEIAKLKYEQGKIDNRDKVEADNDLRSARDSYARARSELRQAYLRFRLSCGVLRVDDNGHWVD